MDYNVESLVLLAVAILISIWVTIWGEMSDQTSSYILPSTENIGRGVRIFLYHCGLQLLHVLAYLCNSKLEANC